MQAVQFEALSKSAWESVPWLGAINRSTGVRDQKAMLIVDWYDYATMHGTATPIESDAKPFCEFRSDAAFSQVGMIKLKWIQSKCKLLVDHYCNRAVLGCLAGYGCWGRPILNEQTSRAQGAALE